MSSFASLLFKKPLLTGTAALSGSVVTIWNCKASSEMLPGSMEDKGTKSGLHTTQVAYALFSPRGIVRVVQSSPKHCTDRPVLSPSFATKGIRKERKGIFLRQDSKRAYTFTSPRGICISQTTPRGGGTEPILHVQSLRQDPLNSILPTEKAGRL